MASRAVVLGGGGVTGIAWEVGVIAGLREAGVDLEAADAVIGTSAGSFVGVALASAAEWDALFARYAGEDLDEPRVATSAELWAGWQAAFVNGGGDYAAVGRGFGQVARAVGSPIDPAVRRRVVESRLVTQEWPERLRVTAVDADSGQLVVFDGASGISLVDAVSASGAVPGIWPSIEWNGRTWIDGGMVSAANASLAAGFEEVVVLAPMAAGYGGIPSAAEDVAALDEAASAILIAPDDASVAAIGTNPYDATRSRVTARAGYSRVDPPRRGWPRSGTGDHRVAQWTKRRPLGTGASRGGSDRI